jgi:uncharacterized membrane protein
MSKFVGEKQRGGQLMSEQPKTETPKTSTGMQENIESLLCYWWVTGIIFLLIEKNSKLVKFHAVQGICISLLYILTVIPILGWILSLVTTIILILAAIKAYQGKYLKVPVVTDFAVKQSGVTL